MGSPMTGPTEWPACMFVQQLGVRQRQLGAAAARPGATSCTGIPWLDPVVSALLPAPDGNIETSEGLMGGFCLGVQWHPEYCRTNLDRTILAVFVRHPSKLARRRTSAIEYMR